MTLALLKELKESLELTYLFITHNLAVVDYIATHVGVMYLGKIMELGTKDEIFSNPKHPYTINLLDSIPSVGKGKRTRKIPRWEIPSPLDPPKGCLFHTRYVQAMDVCLKEEPDERETAKGHLCRCHLYS